MAIALPKIGFGTYLITNHELQTCIPIALKAGYRHIDTAQVYRNEEGVGLALIKSLGTLGLSRDDVFITTKVLPGNPARGQSPLSYSDTLNSIEPSLEKLQLDYVDLYLIHAPFCKNERIDQWRALVELKKLGKAKSIGVSNYSQTHIEEIKSAGLPLPEANQIELHPWCQKTKLISYLKHNDIPVIAFSSLVPLSNWRSKKGENSSKSEQMKADGKDPSSILKVMANKYGVSEAQVLLKWGLQNGYAIIPKSSKQYRIKQNIDLYSFTLDDTDMQKLASLQRSDGGVAWPEGDPTLIA
tara:strand:- start:5640 stop:6536 length:897 start_codon:yes stop_codon:yes gene_type:complete